MYYIECINQERGLAARRTPCICCADVELELELEIEQVRKQVGQLGTLFIYYVVHRALGPGYHHVVM